MGDIRHDTLQQGRCPPPPARVSVSRDLLPTQPGTCLLHEHIRTTARPPNSNDGEPEPSLDPTTAPRRDDGETDHSLPTAPYIMRPQNTSSWGDCGLGSAPQKGANLQVQIRIGRKVILSECFHVKDLFIQEAPAAQGLQEGLDVFSLPPERV